MQLNGSNTNCISRLASQHFRRQGLYWLVHISLGFLCNTTDCLEVTALYASSNISCVNPNSLNRCSHEKDSFDGSWIFSHTLSKNLFRILLFNLHLWIFCFIHAKVHCLCNESSFWWRPWKIKPTFSPLFPARFRVFLAILLNIQNNFLEGRIFIFWWYFTSNLFVNELSHCSYPIFVQFWCSIDPKQTMHMRWSSLLKFPSLEIISDFPNRFRRRHYNISQKYMKSVFEHPCYCYRIVFLSPVHIIKFPIVTLLSRDCLYGCIPSEFCCRK